METQTKTGSEDFYARASIVNDKIRSAVTSATEALKVAYSFSKTNLMTGFAKNHSLEEAEKFYNDGWFAKVLVGTATMFSVFVALEGKGNV